MRILLCASVALFCALANVSGKSISASPEFAMVPDESGWKLVNIHEDPEPESFFTPEIDIIFTLFTRNTRDGEVIRWNDNAWISNSAFNPNNPIRVTIHGWNGSPTSNVNVGIRNALFDVGEFNVIQVDWSAGAGTVNYISARNRVGPTGVVVANLLSLIAENTGLNVDDMVVIGHSLGAHVGGFVGKTLNSRLGTIVALDAALPLFSINNPDARVDAADARYVQSIHTNAGTLGFDEPFANGSFYPNGGSSQPGCGIDISGNCAHGRAHEFYEESIRNRNAFWSRQCPTYQSITGGTCRVADEGAVAIMGGEPVDHNAIGLFLLTTNNASPFGQGQLS